MTIVFTKNNLTIIEKMGVCLNVKGLEAKTRKPLFEITNQNNEVIIKDVHST